MVGFVGFSVVGRLTICVSRCAHLRRSMETRSVRVPRSTLKYFDEREITLNGPSYGGCRGFRTASRRMKTWVHVCKSFGTCVLRGLARSCGACKSCNVRLRRST